MDSVCRLLFSACYSEWMGVAVRRDIAHRFELVWSMEFWGSLFSIVDPGQSAYDRIAVAVGPIFTKFPLFEMVAFFIFWSAGFGLVIYLVTSHAYGAKRGDVGVLSLGVFLPSVVSFDGKIPQQPKKSDPICLTSKNQSRNGGDK
jgi:hypothetical protein